MIQAKQKKSATRKFGVILSGGISLGLTYVGVHRAFWEAELKPSAIGGCSVGAVMGALWAAGLTPYEIEKVTSQARWPGLVGLRRNRLGLFSFSKLASLVEEACGVNFIEDLPIPLAISATNLASGEQVMLREGRLGEAVAASCAIPGLFAPVTIDDMLLVDGGVRLNLPASILNNLDDLSFVFAVDPIRRLSIGVKPSNPLTAMLQSFLIYLQTQSKYAPMECSKPMLLAAPKIIGVNPLDFKQLAEMQQMGYDEANRAFAQFGGWFTDGPSAGTTIAEVF